MYGLSPVIGILDITMGRLSRFKPQLPFTGHGGKAKTSSEGSHSEKESYAGPFDNSPIPRLTIHSFIMGVFVSSKTPSPSEYPANYCIFKSCREAILTPASGRFHFRI